MTRTVGTRGSAPAGRKDYRSFSFWLETAGEEIVPRPPLSGPTEFKRDASLAKLFGAPEMVEFRKLSGTLPPGTAVEFTEFRGVPRTKFHLRVRDPGFERGQLGELPGAVDGQAEACGAQQQ